MRVAIGGMVGLLDGVSAGGDNVVALGNVVPVGLHTANHRPGAMLRAVLLLPSETGTHKVHVCGAQSCS